MTVAQKECRHCAAGVDNDDRFCRECGSRLVQYSNKFSTVLLEQWRKDETANPLLKAELVLTVAISTFVLSALVWAKHGVETTPKKASKVQVAAKPGSEIDRLFAEAKTAPPTRMTKPVGVKQDPLVVPVPVAVVATPKVNTQAAHAPANKLHDDVAEYNQNLANFFGHRLEDTAGGAINTEPPSFEEWLKAGKPKF